MFFAIIPIHPPYISQEVVTSETLSSWVRILRCKGLGFRVCGFRALGVWCCEKCSEGCGRWLLSRVLGLQGNRGAKGRLGEFKVLSSGQTRNLPTSCGNTRKRGDLLLQACKKEKGRPQFCATPITSAFSLTFSSFHLDSLYDFFSQLGSMLTETSLGWPF